MSGLCVNPRATGPALCHVYSSLGGRPIYILQGWLWRCWDCRPKKPLFHKASATLPQLRLSICPNLSASGTLPWTLVWIRIPWANNFEAKCVNNGGLSIIWLSWFHIISGDLLMIVLPLIVISHNDWVGAFRSSNAIVRTWHIGISIFRMVSFRDLLNFRLSCHFRGILNFGSSFFKLIL